MDSDLRHIREIENVLQGLPAKRDPNVVQSWLRCLQQHRLDPATRGEAYILPQAQLRQHQQQSEELIAIARSGIENLYALVAGQNYVLLLADRAGVTVEYLGDEAQKAELRRSGLYMGAEWSESRAGTCALGSCIESGEPLIIHQSDHFDVTHGGLSCTAAPIYDSRGRLSAVLDLSLLSSPRPKASQSLALNLVCQSVKRIEMANLMAEARHEWVLRLSRSPDFLDVDPEAAISLDGSGRVIGMTHEAARLMARAGGVDWRRPEMLIGKPVSDFLEMRLDQIEDLTRLRPASERLVETRDGHRMFAHAIEPRRKSPVNRSLARTAGTTAKIPAALNGLAGDDLSMTQLLRRAAALAAGNLPLLIEGETGTGKLTLARAIHTAERKGAASVLHCAGLSEADDVLVFGHIEGRRHRPGLLDKAAGGTLILDKVGELPLRLQARLLQLVSEGSYLPVGGLRPISPAVRLIATSQGDLAQQVEDGGFRRDLYHNLAGATLHIPPLRERRDMFWILYRFLNDAFGQPTVLGSQVPAQLASYPWPGNLRELAQFATSIAATSTQPRLELDDLPSKMMATFSASRGNASLLVQMLQETGGNISECARRMGVDRSTIHRRIKRLGLPLIAASRGCR